MNEGQLDDVPTLTRPKRIVGDPTSHLVPALTIISHPDMQRVGERLLLEDLLAGREVFLSRTAPEFVRPGVAPGSPLADRGLSRRPLRFGPGAEGGVRLLLEEGGTQVVAGEPIQGGREFGPEELAAGVPLELAERVVLLLHLTEPETGGPAPDSLGMVGESTGTRRVRGHIERVADLQVPVLIRGETGTGKELVAQAIHRLSKRRDERFMSVNLGAIPRELAAAELFGVKKDAYTGATRDREGYFRAAQGGTLFLDEVGEAPPEVQVMLLRVLEAGEMYPVGGTSPVRTDVRLIAATDANLEERIRDGHFKGPLLHRLMGYDIRVPPLRERREDIGLLFFHFAREELEALGETWRLNTPAPSAEPWLPAPLAARLVRYSWPGNIRQLRNLTRQLVIASRGQPRLRVDPQIERELRSPMTSSPGRALPVPELSEPRATPPPASRRRPSDISEQELIAALRANSWDIKPAADQLGIPRTSVYDMIERSKTLRTAGNLSAEEITRCYQECQGNLDDMVRRLEVSRQALRRRLKEMGLEP